MPTINYKIIRNTSAGNLIQDGTGYEICEARCHIQLTRFAEDLETQTTKGSL